MYSYFDQKGVREAKEDLAEAREHGLDLVIWHIHGDADDLPTHDRGRLEKIFRLKREFRPPSESPLDYIDRLITKGRIIEQNGSIYIARHSIVLDFRTKDEGIQENTEETCFYDVEDSRLARSGSNGKLLARMVPTFEEVTGIVTVRRHNFRLDYQNWFEAGGLIMDNPTEQNSGAEKPDELISYF
jgi:hypothetical protein